MASVKKFLSLRPLITYLRFKLRLSRDKNDMATTVEQVRTGARMTGANLWVLVLAIFTASLGLNVNSTAVIIGAMLISPLMGPIVAVGMGLAIQDTGLVYRGFKNFFLAVFLSILTSTLYFLLSPVKVPGSELLARTSPTIYDVLIAIVGGVAGIVAGSSKLRQSNVVPGVAIATALMPPLCTVGFGIANLNPNYIVGAFYLFFINSVFISLSTYFVVRFLGYPTVAHIHGSRALAIKRIIAGVVVVTLVPSVFLTFQIVKKYILEEKAGRFVKSVIDDQSRIILKSEAIYSGVKPVLRLSILGTEVDSMELIAMKNKLKDFGLENVTLEIRQGLTHDNRGAALIGNITNSLETNSEAIEQLFIEVDSLQRHLSARANADSLQQRIGRLAKQQFPNLLSLRLMHNNVFSGNADSNTTFWEVDCRFSGKTGVKQSALFQQWLKTELMGDSILVNVDWQN